MKKPADPNADKILVRLIKEQWELRNKDEPSQAYLDTKSMMIKKLRKDLASYGENEFEYGEYAMSLVREWKK